MRIYWFKPLAHCFLKQFLHFLWVWKLLFISFQQYLRAFLSEVFVSCTRHHFTFSRPPPTKPLLPISSTLCQFLPPSAPLSPSLYYHHPVPSLNPYHHRSNSWPFASHTHTHKLFFTYRGTRRKWGREREK